MQSQTRWWLLLGAMSVAACSSWTGPGEEDGVTMVPDPIDPRDAAVPPDTLDAGERTPDASHGDAGAGDAGSDGGSTTELGDDRPGYKQCSDAACGPTGTVLCCGSVGGEPDFWCAAHCGPTESSFDCDGPEDCDDGQVCCHQLTSFGLRGACMAAEVASADGGPATRQCVSAAEGPAQHVACHTDDDCRDAPGTPLCRAAAAGSFLGHCIAENDDPATPGHDDMGLVGCGDPEQDGVGASCALGSQVCCLSRVAAHVAACAADACGRSELSVTCDGPEDCSGSACCHVPEQAGADGGVSPARTECADRCDALAPDARTRCHTSADCDEGQECHPDEASPWWGRCAAP